MWLKSILQNKKIEVWGDGSVIRDYVYVMDVANAVVNAFDMVDGAAVYNIGGGKEYSVNDIITEIKIVLVFHLK